MLLLLMAFDGTAASKLLMLYDKYHANMLRYARSLLRCFGDENYTKNSEDVVQNAFVRIAKSIDKIDMTAQENVIGGYLMKIVKNEAIIFEKKQKKHLSLDQMLTICKECDIFEEYSRKELYIKVVKEIDRLDDIYRKPLRLYFIEEKSVAEIAHMLGKPEKTVYTQIERGLAILREKFKDEVI